MVILLLLLVGLQLAGLTLDNHAKVAQWLGGDALPPPLTDDRLAATTGAETWADHEEVSPLQPTKVGHSDLVDEATQAIEVEEVDQVEAALRILQRGGKTGRVASRTPKPRSKPRL